MADAPASLSMPALAESEPPAWPPAVLSPPENLGPLQAVAIAIADKADNTSAKARFIGVTTGQLLHAGRRDKRRVRQIADRLASGVGFGHIAAMFGRWLRGEGAAERLSSGDALHASIARELPGADTETVTVVTSMAGLLGAVAYADRNYSVQEEARVRQELERVHGMSVAGIDAICKVLREHIVEISTVQIPRYARALVELADPELRREVLSALIDLAAADSSISVVETNLLRQITKSLGLSQQDYVELQARHRELLEALKGS
jgi:uncharacterized tellurite resistance protein B-like protein